MTYKQLYESAVSVLAAAGIDDTEFDARELMLSVCDLSATQFLLQAENEVSESRVCACSALVERRAKGEPLQYILGKWSFLNGEYVVGNGVLIPRPETEQLADLCIEKVKKDNIKVVYDLCAGSGCIGISIAKACPATKVYLFEKYAEASAYCRRNILLNRAQNAELLEWDIFNGLPNAYPVPELLVSNPPYVPAGEMRNLQREVLFEPETALDGGADGLIFYRAIAGGWLANLPGPVVCAVECGEGQSEKIAGLFSCFGKTRVISDLFGTQRFVALNF